MTAGSDKGRSKNRRPDIAAEVFCGHRALKDQMVAWVPFKTQSQATRNMPARDAPHGYRADSTKLDLDLDARRL